MIIMRYEVSFIDKRLNRRVIFGRTHTFKEAESIANSLKGDPNLESGEIWDSKLPISVKERKKQ